ncbi:MAG: hypothetical protein A3H27_07290 [Acidobacteria bacterium RIFCSPLOWO2_02_FULL_59_13]|nr:MAG: hypothetical protein A3H27_07290 [Acidobacteria bacterium RIFCSPLOWO2_02_FULL_59_13]
MSKFLRVLLIGCAWSASYALLGGGTELLGQQAKEIINLKQHPVRYDNNLGAGVARIGEGRLWQIDATLVEIPPGGQLAPRRHLAEEMTYIVSGRGHTLMWNGPEGNKQRYEWKEGDLLSPTLNAWQQHVNGSSGEPARYLVISTAPLTKKLFQNPAFLSSVDFSFDERWKDSVGREPKYVPGGEGAMSVRMMVGHLLPDVKNRRMMYRGNNMMGITISPEGDMAANRLLEMEVREFTTGEAAGPHHRHLWEVVYYVLNGNGYSVLQREGEPERRIDWKEGDLFIVEANEYHNHRAREGAGARRIQMKASGYFHDVGIDKYLMQTKPAADSPR